MMFNKSAHLVRLAIEANPKHLNLRLKNLTVDNDKEFADHKAVDQKLEIKTHFADQCCSWQHGSKEKFNGLLLRHIPK